MTVVAARTASPGSVPRFERRKQLFASSVGRVVDLCRSGSQEIPELEGVTAEFQICLPYRGFLVWQVGGEDVPADANQVLFVRGGEWYRVREPLPGGFGELLLVPERETLEELGHRAGGHLATHPLFRRRALRASPALLALRTQLLCRLASSTEDPLAGEELLLAVLRQALAPGAHSAVPAGAATARLLARTKEYLAAALENRLLLADIGRAVGASPAYLTDAFRRLEGVPLHRYLTELRLSRALTELPHAEDLTRLALDSGFSSHSHFTDAFRRTFGATPSAFRQQVRGGAAPLLGSAPRPAGRASAE